MTNINPWPVILILCLFFIIYQGGYRLYQIRVKEMSDALYKDGNYQDFKRILERFTTKAVVPKAQRELLDLDANILLGNKEQIEEKIHVLTGMKLNSAQKADLYRDEIIYYVENKDEDRANGTLSKFHDELGSSNISLIRGYLKEAEYQVKIDMGRDTSYLSLMEEKAKEAKAKQSKGLYQYRSGLLLLKLGKQKEAKTYFKEALLNLKDTGYQQIIENQLSEVENA